MKQAVETHLSEGNRCWFEDTMGSWGGEGSLRVDVHYYRKGRSYYVECETMPNIKRLRKKGEKRNGWGRRTDYNLIVPSTEFTKKDWTKLRGYFDLVYGYDVNQDKICFRKDLRRLGVLQDLVLDIWMPVRRSSRFKGMEWWFIRRKNLCAGCVMCLRGKYPPRRDCWDAPCILFNLLLMILRITGTEERFFKW